LDGRALNSAKLREWLEIIGILAVVASLVFVGIEIRQTSRAALEESFVGDLGTMIALEEIVVENSDVWLRGCRAEELNDVERVQFTRMYHMHEFLFFMRWLRGTEGVAAANDDLTIDNMAWNLYRSKGLQREWDLHGAWRPHVPDHMPFQRWRALVEARVAEYPAFEPEPIENVFRCGLN
jgi:hypothetical protein